MYELQRDSNPTADEINESEVSWLRPELVAEIGFAEWTKDDKLRHPRYLGLRRDKNPEGVIKEKP